jgi:hypothetical protein
MPVGRRWVSIVFAAVAGVLLLVSGVRGPVGTYALVRKQLPLFLDNSQVIQVVNFVALVLIAIALGGIKCSGWRLFDLQGSCWYWESVYRIRRWCRHTLVYYACCDLGYLRRDCDCSGAAYQRGMGRRVFGFSRKTGRKITCLHRLLGGKQTGARFSKCMTSKNSQYR